MISATSDSISALNAFQKKMNVTADNVANVLTDDFKKSRVTFQEKSPGGVKAIVDRVETQGIPKETMQNDEVVTVQSSNVDLSEELTDMISATAAYDANIATVKTQEEMVGALLDILG